MLVLFFIASFPLVQPKGLYIVAKLKSPESLRPQGNRRVGSLAQVTRASAKQATAALIAALELQAHPNVGLWRGHLFLNVLVVVCVCVFFFYPPMVKDTSPIGFLRDSHVG